MVNDRQSVLLCIGRTIEQYQRLTCKTTLMPWERGADPSSALAVMSTIEGGGGASLAGPAPGRPRGEKSRLRQAAGNSLTRFTPKSSGPDFSFSGNILGLSDE